jgi:hypothetical protein
MDSVIVTYGHGLYDLLKFNKFHSQKKNAKTVVAVWFPVQTLGRSCGGWKFSL